MLAYKFTKDCISQSQFRRINPHSCYFSPFEWAICSQITDLEENAKTDAYEHAFNWSLVGGMPLAGREAQWKRTCTKDADFLAHNYRARHVFANHSKTKENAGATKSWQFNEKGSCWCLISYRFGTLQFAYETLIKSGQVRFISCSYSVSFVFPPVTILHVCVVLVSIALSCCV